MNSRISLPLVLLLSACAPTVSEEMYTTHTFEPTKNVEILKSWPTDRKYVEIAKLETSEDDNAINELRQRAMEIGADAIVIGPAHKHGQVLVPLSGGYNATGGAFATIRFDRIHATAIKYVP